jgi:hypothetical protein
MSTATEHKGCRVCGRTDVGLKKDGTLRMHVHAAYKGSGFLRPGGSRCDGVGHPPKGALGTYARTVVDALRPHFDDLGKLYIAEVIGEAIQKHRTSPSNAFEALLDERGNWRLKPDGRDTGRVRLACYRFTESDADRDLVERINALLADLRG